MLEQKRYEEIIAEGQLEKIRVAHELIEEILADQFKLGSGQNAEVFFSNDAIRQDFCVKQLKESPDRKHYQSIHREMKVQEDVRKLGIRVPQPILALTTEDEQSFMVMETIKGQSLQDIIDHKLDLPTSYNDEKFWNKLKKMITDMHDDNIYHRDLHFGNVMMEFSSGEPVLIDFGWSAYVPGGDDPYREIDHNINHQEDFPNDDVQFRNIRRRWQEYLTNLSK